MSAGIEILASNYRTQIGSSGSPLLKLVGSGVLSVAAGASYNIPRKSIDELLFISAPSGVYVCRRYSSETQHVIKILNQGTTNLKWYTFSKYRETPNVNLDRFGFEVFSETGDVVYHSSFKIARITNAIKVADGESESLSGYFNSSVNAACLTTNRFYLYDPILESSAASLYTDCLLFKTNSVSAGLINVSTEYPRYGYRPSSYVGGYILIIDVTGY